MPIPDELRRFEAFGRDKELRFTNDYVIPVLQQLGLSVVYNHGQREFGRDLVVGELDTFNHFIYFGVQVKFEPHIGIGDASRDLANDARQAFARMERNENISNKFMSNEELRAVALELMMRQVYTHFQEGSQPAA